MEKAYVNEETSFPPGVCRRARARGDGPSVRSLADAPRPLARTGHPGLVPGGRRQYCADIEGRADAGGRCAQPGPGACRRHHRAARRWDRPRCGPGLRERGRGRDFPERLGERGARVRQRPGRLRPQGARRVAGRDPQGPGRHGRVPGARGARERRGHRRCRGRHPGLEGGGAGSREPERPTHDAHRPGHPEGRGQGHCRHRHGGGHGAPGVHARADRHARSV